MYKYLRWGFDRFAYLVSAVNFAMALVSVLSGRYAEMGFCIVVGAIFLRLGRQDVENSRAIRIAQNYYELAEFFGKELEVYRGKDWVEEASLKWHNDCVLKERNLDPFFEDPLKKRIGL
jgi:hypothetical protein